MNTLESLYWQVEWKYQGNNIFIIIQEQSLNSFEYYVSNITEDTNIRFKQSEVEEDLFEDLDSKIVEKSYTLDNHNWDQILDLEFVNNGERFIGQLDLSIMNQLIKYDFETIFIYVKIINNGVSKIITFLDID